MKKKTCFVYVIAIALIAGSSGSALAGVKASITGLQLQANQDGAAPRSVSVFAGERISSFGDVGIFGQYIFSSKSVGAYRTAGMQIAPDLFDKAWGGMLWSNKIGFGNYRGAGQITIGSGFILEPGSLFHLSFEVLKPVEVSGHGREAYPFVYGVGLGFHLE